MDYILETRDLTKSYGGHLVLDKINLTLEPGKIIGLLGPNGSGKSTLMKLINRLILPSSGSLSICGMPPGPETKKVVAFLPEHSYLDEQLRVSEVIRFFSDFYQDFEKERAYDMLSRLDISPDVRIKTLSKGTKEKVQLLLVMSRRARLYCLDEPIAGVDPAARDYILRTILNNYDASASILISTHLIQDVENILDDAVFIQCGKVQLQASVEDIRIQYGKSVDELFREVFKC